MLLKEVLGRAPGARPRRRAPARQRHGLHACCHAVRGPLCVALGGSFGAGFRSHCVAKAEAAQQLPAAVALEQQPQERPHFALLGASGGGLCSNEAAAKQHKPR